MKVPSRSILHSFWDKSPFSACVIFPCLKSVIDMYVYLCACATDKRTGYWHKHQYLGFFWISFCMLHLNKWVGGSTIQLVTKNSGNSASPYFFLFFLLNKLWHIRSTIKLFDCCRLPQFQSVIGLLNWSRRHMLGDFIGSVGLLAVMANLYSTPNMTWQFSATVYDCSYNLLWQFCISAALPDWLLNCVLSREIKQTLELWATQRGSQIDQTQVSVCDDVALGPGEDFRLHSDQNCPDIPALLDSRTGTAPVEGKRTHTRTHTDQLWDSDQMMCVYYWNRCTPQGHSKIKSNINFEYFLWKMQFWDTNRQLWEMVTSNNSEIWSHNYEW